MTCPVCCQTWPKTLAVGEQIECTCGRVFERTPDVFERTPGAMAAGVSLRFIENRGRA